MDQPGRRNSVHTELLAVMSYVVYKELLPAVSEIADILHMSQKVVHAFSDIAAHLPGDGG